MSAPLCWVCNDIRAVYATHEKFRKAVPCPVCAQFIKGKDDTGKPFDDQPIRCLSYGNPFILTSDDYREWRRRAESRRGKPHLTEYTVRGNSFILATFNKLRLDYPRADIRWVLAWTEGQSGEPAVRRVPLLPIDFSDAEWAAIVHEEKEFNITREQAMFNAEDRRYDPSKDAEFMATIPARLEAWQATRKGPE